MRKNEKRKKRKILWIEQYNGYRFVIVEGPLGDPNAPMPEFVKEKMKHMEEALKYPGLPARYYEKGESDIG